MKSFISDNKGCLIFCAIILITVVLYAAAGHSIVVRVCESGNDAASLKQQRIVLTDKIVFLVLAAVSVCFVLGKITFSPDKINLGWTLLIFTAILVCIYKLNPNNRVYSFHGFMHAGMVYQILNGEIPPSNALMSGHELPYPWGYEYITARITDIFEISPFYSFAITNVISLTVCMTLIYLISRLLIKDKRANILSAIVSVFGSTLFTPVMLRFLRRMNIFAESRGYPVFEKFGNINGTPLGLVFYLLFLYSVIRIFVDRRLGLTAFLFLLSVVGCGFVYPQFLPAVIAVTLASCLVHIVWRRMENGGPCFLRSVTAIVLLIAGCAILYPYFSSIGSGVQGRMQLFSAGNLFMNTVNYIILCLPMLLAVFLGRKFMGKDLDKRVLAVVVSAVAVTFGCYVFIHLAWTNEYKFLMLSMVSLGILGGVSLAGLTHRWPKGIVFVILAVFMFPAFSNMYSRLRHFDSFEPPYIEKGKYIYSRNTEENELYEWIRNNTNAEDVFIDTEPLLPVLAQRRMYIAVDKRVQDRIVRSPGYSFLLMDFFRLICGYDIDLIAKRTGIVYTIYSSNRNLTPAQKEDLFAAGNRVYVIVRKAVVKRSLNRRDFVEAFRSFRGNFLVYRFAVPSSQT